LRVEASQLFDPLNDARDIGINREMAVAYGDAEEMTAAFLPHNSSDAPREKGQLFTGWWGLARCSAIRSRPSFSYGLLLRIRAVINPRPSVDHQQRSLDTIK
jgi:hypothetical protein